MELISRAEAKRQGLKQYFTGEQCKNGHVAFRYTQSGTCSGCLRAAGSVTDTAEYVLRRQATDQLVQVKFRLFREDVELFAASAHAFGVMRFPILRKVDIYPGLLPLDSCANTGLYKFNCHADDIAPLRELAVELCKAHTLDVDARRLQIIQGAAAYLPPDTTPPMSFK